MQNKIGAKILGLWTGVSIATVERGGNR